MFPSGSLAANQFRFRISPDVLLGLAMMVKSSEDEIRGELTEMLAMEHPRADEMDAYERVLRDAMAGDATLFAREDYVEEAWRIVDPVLKANTPVNEYEPGSWGPADVNERIVPPDGWHNPLITSQAAAATERHAA